jgi:hypothetical protein
MTLVFQFPISIHQPYHAEQKVKTQPQTQQDQSKHSLPTNRAKKPEPKLLGKLSFSPFDLSHQITVLLGMKHGLRRTMAGFEGWVYHGKRKS